MRWFLTAVCAVCLVGNAQAQVSDATKAANATAAAALNWEDAEDEDFASRGLIATWDEPRIMTDDGRVAWDFTLYDFLKSDAPETVNPSLWRQAQLLSKAGLFKVTDRVYQVRGFDVANMTVVIGDTGYIVIDPLISKEVATAAMTLVRRQLGDRPIKAVIYTHSHIDHFGGVKGIVDPADVAAGKVQIIAPAGFMEEAVSENIIAGNAMNRRGQFQFGVGLVPGPEGQVSAGIGIRVATGAITLIPPTHTIERTGETMEIDGVHVEFQVTPGTEAPSEMNFFLPDFGVLDLAENANATMHNVLTPRGALVRDAKAWADYLTESLRLYGDRTDIMIASHTWPRFGGDRVRDFIASHRDAYKYLHDQTVRMMNAGLTDREIADQIELPPTLARRWFNRGYYGTMRFNSRAVYQRYMGWYSGNPADLNPLPPEEEGRRFVRAMGGESRVLAEAQRAFDEGDYRWGARVLNNLIFANPDNQAARMLLARTDRQMAYQAESATWRNMYLVAARELEGGAPTLPPRQSSDVVAEMPSSFVLDLLAVRLNPERLPADRRYLFNVVFSDRGETFGVSIANDVLVYERDVIHQGSPTLTSPRALFLSALSTHQLSAALMDHTVTISDDDGSLAGLDEIFEVPNSNFPIVTP